MSLPEHTLTIYDHPEPHSHRWSDLELEAIKRYAEAYALIALVQQVPERKGEPAATITFGDSGAIRRAVLHDEALKGQHVTLYTSPQVSEGFALVPVEPTPAMKSAGIEVEIYNEAADRIGALTWNEVASIYRAMLDAARKGE